MQNKLYYGDNIDVLRRFIKDQTIDLCYIDPPFNSKRNYNQIYNNIGTEDKAQSQAFIDTWTWDESAERGLQEIITNYNGVFTVQSIELIVGLTKVLGKGSLLAYLISMTLRIAEIHRVLKSTGSFYLHCDPTASHYLKLVCDAIFVPKGGDFKNEIVWKRYATHNISTKKFDAVSDTILFYTKDTNSSYFKSIHGDTNDASLRKKFPHYEAETNRYFQHVALEQSSNQSNKSEERIINGKVVKTTLGWRWTQETFDERIKANPHIIYWTKNGRPRYKIYLDEYAGTPIGNIWTDIPYLSAADKERLGYPTQKPEALLERIILASSNEGDMVLDAFCGCGTTVAVAQRLNRNWIGIDITYQSISLIIKRLNDTFGEQIHQHYELNGVPKDFESAKALALKKEDKTRKEFEKWMVLTYTRNRAIINDKKGGDGGIDGTAFIVDRNPATNAIEPQKVIFSVKSSKTLNPSIIRDLFGTLEREKAVAAYLLTLYPAENLIKECKQYGLYDNQLIGKSFAKIQVISVQDLFDGARFDMPVTMDVVKSATQFNSGKDANQTQLELS